MRWSYRCARRNHISTLERCSKLRRALSRAFTWRPFLSLIVEQDLHRMLVNHFRWKIGEQRVTERRYCVARAGGAEGGTLVMANDWDSIRENPEELVMSMLIEQVFKAEFQKLCPKCGKTRLGTYEDQGWRVWYVDRHVLLWFPV